MLQKRIDYNFCIYDVCNDVLLNNCFYYLKNDICMCNPISYKSYNKRNNCKSTATHKKNCP